MTLSLLATIQEFTDRTGLDRPEAVMSSQDDTIRQLRGLANEVITDISNRGQAWDKMTATAVFTSVATASQGAMSAIAPYGFKYFLEDSLYDRTERRPLYGPRNASKWQESIALPYTGPYYTYRVLDGNFCIQPDPPAGHTLAFEYASDMAILAADGTTRKKRFTADDDYFVLDEDLMLMGLRWKWRRAIGQSYAQEKVDYEILVTQAIGTAPDKGEVNLNGGSGDRVSPGVFVPLGNWNV